MNRASLKGQCDFEDLPEADLLASLSTLSGSSGESVIHSKLGNGFERFLNWAVSDIVLAGESKDSEEIAKLSTNAVMSARRSLSCLTDQYLIREGLAFCKDAPKKAEDKANLLKMTGIFDGLTARVLQRAIDKRNSAEHDYLSLSLDEAQDVVEVVRRTIQSVTHSSDPYHGPCIFGFFQHSHWAGSAGMGYSFRGWGEPCAVLVTFEPLPWIGIILPTLGNEAHAVVRRLYLRDTRVETLLDALRLLREKFPHAGCESYAGSRIIRGILAEAGVI